MKKALWQRFEKEWESSFWQYGRQHQQTDKNFAAPFQTE